MTQDRTPKYTTVQGAPVKSFFVSMLTRDIQLEEAILDLLDNCVDGILRTGISDPVKPYEGYWANIEFDETTFTISDNCGGISWNLCDYAFRMGRDPARPPDAAGVVGVYGIGMKRAIFKMGRRCLISTQSGEDHYEVDITPEWLEDEQQWDLPVHEGKHSLAEDGTTILVSDLYDGIATNFGKNVNLFTTHLTHLIAGHYAFIIDKGLKVIVNGQSVEPRSRDLIFDTNSSPDDLGIQPFIYQAKTADGVDVFLTVGLTRPILSEEDAQNEVNEIRYSSEEAGWTVICNDRAVLFCDRTELTGWGESGVPRYHTQFIAIYGVVEFRADDPSKLPTTTTKLGLDASSVLYLQVKNKMREGLKMFTDYTNHWKGQADETRDQVKRGSALSFNQVKTLTEKLDLNRTSRSLPGATQYKPRLPRPEKTRTRRRRISFTKDIDEVRSVAEYLYDDPTATPSSVGEECFDIIHRGIRH